MLRQITHKPKVTHHSWIPWQWLIYLSCPWHMPQLESNFLQTSLFSFLVYFFLLSTVVQLQHCHTLGTLSLPPGAVWSQNIASRFLGDCKREIWGQGLYIASWWWAILLNGSQCGMTFFRNCSKWPSELRARTKRLHYRLWLSFCYSGSNEKSNGIAEKTTIKPGMNAYGYTTVGNVLKP